MSASNWLTDWTNGGSPGFGLASEINPTYGSFSSTAKSSSARSGLPGYNVNPGTQTGSGAYGSVPASIDVPPSLWQQVTKSAPEIAGLLGGVGSVIGDQLSGKLSHGTVDALTRTAAERGISLGMPGSGIATNDLFANVAGYSDKLQQEGVQNFINSLSTVAGLQTPQSLAAEIASRNATMASSPNPAASAAAQENTYLRNLTNAYMLSRAAGGTGTGGWHRGTFTPPIVGSGGSGSFHYSMPDLTQGGWGSAYDNPMGLGGYSDMVGATVIPGSEYYDEAPYYDEGDYYGD